MGRRIPDDNLSLSLKLHPVLYLSFLALGVVASIAVVTSLCSILTFWKKPSSKKSKHGTNLPEAAPAEETGNTHHQEPQVEEDTGNNDDEVAAKELPLPPALQYQANDLCASSIKMKRAASERRMSFSSLSKKLPRTLSAARIGKDHLKGKQREDSVWMKTIILGGKCQVPEDEKDAVIYEQKGKKVEAYHPRTKSSKSFSNISSISIDADEAPRQGRLRQNEEENLNKS